MISRLLRNSSLVSAPASVAMALALMSAPMHQHVGKALSTEANQNLHANVTNVAYARTTVKIMHGEYP